MQRALVAETTRTRLARAAAGIRCRKAARWLPSEPESTRLDTPSCAPREHRSSVEPNTEQALWDHWFSFIPLAASRFVGMNIPFEQTTGMCGIVDRRDRTRVMRSSSVDRIKDENQEKWLGVPTNRRDALTTDVQFAKSLLSVVDSQAALERAGTRNESDAIERKAHQEAVNGTLPTRRIAFAVTHDLRPHVRLFALARDDEKSLMWSCRSSEVASSTSRLCRGRSACFACSSRNGRRVLRSGVNTGIEPIECECARAELLGRSPIPEWMSSRASSGFALRYVRCFFGTRTGTREVASGSRARVPLQRSPGALHRGRHSNESVDVRGAWRDSLQEHGSRTVSSYPRWSPPDRRGRSS